MVPPFSEARQPINLTAFVDVNWVCIGVRLPRSGLICLLDHWNRPGSGQPVIQPCDSRLNDISELLATQSHFSLLLNKIIITIRSDI